MGLFRKLIKSQVAMCRWLDARFFADMSVDGNGHYLREVDEIVPDGSRVADVGGGKRPFFSAEAVMARNLRVTGIDIDADELAHAPPGAYHRSIVSPIERVEGPAVNDVVVAQSVLEHVVNGKNAIRGCASLLAGGGHLYTFCPNRHAWFAVLNRMLPEAMKRSILFSIFPEKKEKQGFPAFYDGCTPRQMQRNIETAGLSVVVVRHFFVSSYFMFFFPLYLTWRLVNWPLMKMWPDIFCETFMTVSVKKQ